MIKRTFYSNGRSCIDHTPGCVFANNTIRFERFQKSPKLDGFLKEKTVSPGDPEDREFTEYLRENEKLVKRVFPGANLRLPTMPQNVDGAAILLPLDNSLNCDYLTYRDPRYRKFITQFCDELMKLNPVAYEDSVRILPIDYSVMNPHSVIIKRDGALRVSDDEWPPELRKLFSQFLADLLCDDIESNLSDAEVDHFIPAANSSKKIGFYSVRPNGQPVDKSDFLVVPDFLDTKDCPLTMNRWARFNKRDFSLEWLQSGKVANTIGFLLTDAVAPNPKKLLDNLLKCRVSCHVAAIRSNNGDGCENDLSLGMGRAIEEGLYKRNRPICYEDESGQLINATLDDPAYERAFRQADPTLWGLILKGRWIYPGPSSAFGSAANFVYNLYLKRIEESCAGFPSLERSVLQRYSVYCENGNASICWAHIDRKNSEACMTDSIASIFDFFSDDRLGYIKNLTSNLLSSITPSTVSLRYVKGLLSGSAVTTFLNSVVGLFEVCCFISHALFGEKWRAEMPSVLEKQLACLAYCKHASDLSNEDLLFTSYTVGGRQFTVCQNLGTDDQIIGFKSKSMDHGAIEKFISENLEESKYSPDGFIKYELGVVKGFALIFEPSTVSPDLSAGVAKIFLAEKTDHGDNIAHKYCKRLDALPEVKEVIRKLFYDSKFGDIDTYAQGSFNYLKTLTKMGLSAELIEDPNLYNPRERARFVNDILQKNIAAVDLLAKKRNGHHLVSSNEFFNMDTDLANFVDRYNRQEFESVIKTVRNILLH